MNAWINDKCLINDWVWHRRSGKDDCALHGTAIKAHQKVANYWHMLPLKNQVRKAIWDAINPNTGIRRIDEAFPDSICKKRDSDMFIQFHNGSTWQALGSDNFKGAIGSSPYGIVWSEWPLSDPSSYGYLSPILKENGGWVLRQGTPRGKNHGHRTYMSGLTNPNAFSQLLTVKDTGADQTMDMDAILREYIDLFGEDAGQAMFDQENYCSFDAAILGAVWGKELRDLEKDGRFTSVPHSKDHPVHTAWDIGRADATAIWFFQVIDNKIHIIDYAEDKLKDVDYFCSQLTGRVITINLIDDEIVVKKGAKIKGLEHRVRYKYGTHWLPHDARAKTFAAKKSVQQQVMAVFDTVRITPNLSKQDGIQAARKTIKIIKIDFKAEAGFEMVKQYRYEWVEDKRIMSMQPLHDFSSHAADALRYLSVAYRTAAKILVKPANIIKIITPKLTMADMFDGD